MKNTELIVLEDVRMLPGQFRNFKGEMRRNAKGKVVNNEGDRNFTIELSLDQAEKFRDMGFTVNTLPGRDDFEEPTYIMKIKVSYRFKAPKVVVCVGRTKTLLSEETISELDWADVESVDVTFTKSHWTQPDREGETAYLNSMWVTLMDDPLERKYAEQEPEDEEAPF